MLEKKNAGMLLAFQQSTENHMVFSQTIQDLLFFNSCLQEQ